MPGGVANLFAKAEGYKKTALRAALLFLLSLPLKRITGGRSRRPEVILPLQQNDRCPPKGGHSCFGVLLNLLTLSCLLSQLSNNQ
jgi:hypothetical protein